MKNKYLIYILLLIIVFLSFYSLGLNKRVFILQEKSYMENYYEHEKIISVMIKSLEIRGNNKILSNVDVYFGIDSLNECSLRDIVKKPTLFFCFSKDICSPCVNEIVSYIDSIFDISYRENIIFIAPDYPDRFNNNCYNRVLLNSFEIDSLSPIDSKYWPILFVLDNDLRVLDLNVYKKSVSELTKCYLLEIYDKYFNR